MKIDWENLYPVDGLILDRMSFAADRALACEGIAMDCLIHVCLCDDETISGINREYRGIPSSTDVLSFPSVDYPVGQTAGSNEHLLRIEYDDHGICHLMGYDHIKPEDKERMREMEEKILSEISVSRDDQPDSVDDTLLMLAREAMKNSYSPYSSYPVGAALHCTDGRIFTGCNIENASFGLTNCAERTAMFKAVSEGARGFDVIAIAGKTKPWPCGACRQVLNEFAPDIRVIVTWEDHVEEKNLHELLPEGFGPDSM